MPKKSWAFRFAGLPLCLLALALSAIAGPAAGSNVPFIVDSWTAENGPGKGPPDNEIISVVQTHDGYLWLGTLHGLVRFDGIHFTLFDEMNTPGLTSDRIVYLFEDRRTNLWVGTESAGLCRHQKRCRGEIRSRRRGGQNHFCRRGRGRNGLFLQRKREDILRPRWKSKSASGRPFRRNRCITPLFTCAFQEPTPLPGSYRTVGLKNCATAGMKKTAEPVLGQPGWSSPFSIPVAISFRFNSMQMLRQYATIAMAISSLARLATACSGMKRTEPFSALARNRVCPRTTFCPCAWIDEGNLWVGTDGGGLDRIKRTAFGTPAELHPWAAQSLSEDATGGLWVAFGALGVSHWTTNSAQYFHPGQHQDAWETLVDRQQRVWVGTRDDGLFVFQTNHFVPATGAAILGPAIFALFEGRDGQIWAGTQNGLGEFRRTKLEAVHDSRRTFGKRRPRHRGRHRRKFVDRHGKPRIEFVQGREIHLLSRRWWRVARR